MISAKRRYNRIKASEVMSSTTLDDLFQTIAARKGAEPDTSYTASLFAQGASKCAQKLGEEAVETVIAAISGDRKELTKESADLIYHLFVVLAQSDLTPEDVYAELERRSGTSGHVEKASRK
jgi:phosphoribosyl-ATP pyrophosphohydrolase